MKYFDIALLISKTNKCTSYIRKITVFVYCYMFRRNSAILRSRRKQKKLYCDVYQMHMRRFYK
jgi:hypothetical protein